MTRRIVDVAKALAARATITTQDHEHPHFHQGAQGHPAACYERGCPRPQLEI